MLKFRHLLLAGILLASMKTSAHRIEYYTSNGCLTIGQSLVIDAYVVYAPSNTYYQWQFKGSSGGWIYLIDGSNSINGTSYTVSNAKGGPVQDNAPALTFSNPDANLDGVQLRCLMRENYYPSASTSNSPNIWGGDDENVSETKMLRIRYNATSGACAISCDDNLLTNSNGYYGGFEQVSYSNSNQSFSDNNWGSGEGSTDYPDNGGTFKVKNNPYAAYSSFSSAKFAPHSGNYQMVVSGSCNSGDKIWYKTVAVTTGQVYNFSVWVARVDNTSPTIQLKAGSSQIGSAVISASIGNWVQVTGTFTATSNTNITFAILNSSATTGADNFVLDDICLTAYDPISIGDKVWWDVNRNGAQDAGEPGVNAVTVKLFPDINDDNIGDNGTTPTATTTTNSSGIYSFTNIAPGKYFVQFILPSAYTGFTAQDAAPLGSNSTANVTTGKTGTHDFTANYDKKDAGLLKDLTISGNAYNDASALIDNMVNGSPISILGASALHVNLFKGTTFVATTPVSGGNYTFSNLAGNTNYTVVISTVPATAASTPTSILASGWMSTGEFVGSGAGSDGTVNGQVSVSLVMSNVSNVNFGMQQPPTANTATLPAQANPGGANFIAVPATNFGGADPGGGSISFIKLTSFPTNASALKVNNVSYTTATFATVPNIPTNAAGQPTQPISVDPIDGGISVVIPYKTIDNGGAISTNTGNVTVPLTVPDLTPLITATPTVMHGITNFNVTIKVSEISGAATSGLITLYVPKDPRLSFTYNNTLTTIGNPAVSLNNPSWTYTGTNQFFYIFTSTTSIPANGYSTIGFNAQFNPLSAQGVYVLSSVIVSGSGNETKFSNNSSSVSLTYFVD